MNTKFEKIINLCEDMYSITDQAETQAQEIKKAYCNGKPLDGLPLIKVQKCNKITDDIDSIRRLIYKIQVIATRYIDIK